MDKRAWRCFSAFFLLALFLGSKSIEWHAISHSSDGDGVACEWCDDALLIQSTPIQPASEIIVELEVFGSDRGFVESRYLAVAVAAQGWEPFFGRPPPAL